MSTTRCAICTVPDHNLEVVAIQRSNREREHIAPEQFAWLQRSVGRKASWTVIRTNQRFRSFTIQLMLPKPFSSLGLLVG